MSLRVWTAVVFLVTFLVTVLVAVAAFAVQPADIPTADAWTDTLHVAAPRVTLEEIVADVGRRQRANRDSLRSVAFTAVVTTVHTRDGDTRSWDVEETAVRYGQERGRPDRVVQLWQRKQAFKDGAALPAKDDAAVSVSWRPQPVDIVSDLPFSPGGASKYRYELREKTLVGGSLVYTIAFAPRDRFAALPSGVIWVDIADWAIRRIEARFDDAVPYPWVVRSIPRYRQRQAACGDVWFPVLETAQVQLRNLPLTGAGGAYDMRIELRDIVINGEPCDAAEPDDRSDGEAEAFWTAIDDAWHADLPEPLKAPVSLAPAQLDSLSRVGADRLAALPEHAPWRLSWLPLLPAFNRVQGFVPRAGARLGRVGSGTRLAADLGPGLDDRRLTWGVGASAQPHSGLALKLSGARETVAFAGDSRAGWRSWSALWWGADPNHYFDRTVWRAGAAWRPLEAMSLEAGFSQARELPLVVHSRWNVLGLDLDPEAMRAADAVDARSLNAGIGARWGSLTFGAGAARHRVEPRGTARDVERTVNSWRWSARWQPSDAAGNRWTLRAGGRGLDGPAPTQWRVWMGDWKPDEGDTGPLAGWPAGTLLGDRGTWASLAVDLNVDPWRSLRVPGLRDLRLRPLLFAEWADVRGDAGGSWPAGDADPAAGLRAPTTGARSDVGLGFTRRLDLPFAGEGSRVELRAAHAVGEGADGQGWRFVLGIGR